MEEVAVETGTAEKMDGKDAEHIRVVLLFNFITGFPKILFFFS
jgi:hypothetical protein